MATSRKRPLKVYGINTFSQYWHGQRRCIAAVHSQAEFAALIGSSKHYVAGYASDTGNENEVKVALGKPHTLFYQEDRHSEKYLEARGTPAKED